MDFFTYDKFHQAYFSSKGNTVLANSKRETNTVIEWTTDLLPQMNHFLSHKFDLLLSSSKNLRYSRKVRYVKKLKVWVIDLQYRRLPPSYWSQPIDSDDLDQPCKRMGRRTLKQVMDFALKCNEEQSICRDILNRFSTHSDYEPIKKVSKRHVVYTLMFKSHYKLIETVFNVKANPIIMMHMIDKCDKHLNELYKGKYTFSVLQMIDQNRRLDTQSFESLHKPLSFEERLKFTRFIRYKLNYTEFLNSGDSKAKSVLEILKYNIENIRYIIQNEKYGLTTFKRCEDFILEDQFKGVSDDTKLEIHYAALYQMVIYQYYSQL